MKTDQNRVNNLIQYVQGIMNRESGQELFVRYRKDIEEVTPQEAFEIFYSQIEKGAAPSEILVSLDKIINVFYKSLVSYQWKRPEKNSFMGFLMQENDALRQRLEAIKEIIKDGDFQGHKHELISKVRELQKFNAHYLKKENILFPYLEKRMKKFEGLAIMWALHDETRALLKSVIECLEADECNNAEFNEKLGGLFFAMLGLVKKEELILFPAASEVINETEWLEMQKQSLEYEFPFIEKPNQEIAKSTAGEPAPDIEAGYQFKTETGSLNFEEMLMIFNTMPVDITLVDENNKVRFYSDSRDRIFPRSPAVIGRNVEKCHPPASVHVVNEIVDAFRTGAKDKTTFWINLKEKKILIQYFALRDSHGNYKGVLEVSQDITEITKLEGEKRLLQWER